VASHLFRLDLLSSWIAFATPDDPSGDREEGREFVIRYVLEALWFQLGRGQPWLLKRCRSFVQRYPTLAIFW
jgi:hypothetical protein